MDTFANLYFSRDQIKVLFLALLVGLIYLPFLGSPLMFDDVPLFQNSITSFADASFDFTFRCLWPSRPGRGW